jgi:hypothetical protein
MMLGFFDIFKGRKNKELDLPEIEDGAVPEIAPERTNEPVATEQNLQGTELQIILAKLDLINTKLQTIEQRLNNLEQIARQAQDQQSRRW